MSDDATDHANNARIGHSTLPPALIFLWAIAAGLDLAFGRDQRTGRGSLQAHTLCKPWSALQFALSVHSLHRSLTGIV